MISRYVSSYRTGKSTGTISPFITHHHHGPERVIIIHHHSDHFPRSLFLRINLVTSCNNFRRLCLLCCIQVERRGWFIRLMALCALARLHYDTKSEPNARARKRDLYFLCSCLRSLDSLSISFSLNPKNSDHLGTNNNSFLSSMIFDTTNHHISSS